MAGVQIVPPPQLLGRYSIIDLIGTGAMGAVYRAHDAKLQRDVAIKFLFPGLLTSQERRDRIRQEALAISRIDHPSVATVFDYVSEDGQNCLICEFVAGRPLSEILRDGPLSEKEAFELVTQLVEGLAACHEHNVIHGDIKPANLRVSDDHRLKIVDFGLASAAGISFKPDADTVESLPALAGTLPYMSPERLSGCSADARSDIFSVGCVLYESVTGHLPFPGKTLSAIVEAVMHHEPESPTVYAPSLSLHLASIIERSIEKQPDLRYQTARDLLADLRRAMIAIPAERSLAVLYFENLSRDKGDEYFRDGITEDVITELSKIKDLRVFSRSAVLGFRDRPVTPSYIGKQLKASFVLEGSLRRDGDRLRLTANLADTRTGHTLWAERYDRRLEDLFAVQDDVARSIARELQIALTSLEKSSISKVPTADIGAYDLYLRGRHFFQQFTRAGLERAREMFAQAINTDPRFARAHAGLANSFSLLYLYYDSNPSLLFEADKASHTALELDKDSAESRVSRGLAASLKKDYGEAQRQFEEAIRLNPRLFEPYYFLARNAYCCGNKEQAVWWFEQATQVDPDDYQALLLCGSSLAGLNRLDESHAVYRLGLQNVQRHLENHPSDARAYYLGAVALAQLGDKERAKKWASRAMELEPAEPMVLYNVACVYAVLGEKDLALEALARSATKGWGIREWMANDPDLSNVRDDPRFQQILQSIP